MRAFSIIECCMFLIFIGYLVFDYSSRKVPFYVKVIVYVSWVTSFAFVFLLPLDIYYSRHISLSKESLESVAPELEAIHSTWDFIYWINFVLIWIILPLLQEYEDAGEFNWKDKVKRSIRNNLLFYGIFIAIGGVFMIYLAFFGQMSFSAMMELFAGLSNCFGMFLVVLLMGHGLVAIPKSYIGQRDSEQNLKLFQGQAKMAEARVAASKIECENLVRLVTFYRETFDGKEIGQFCLNILEEIPFKVVRDELTQENSILDLSREVKVDMNRIIQIHKEVKRSLADYERAETKWRILQDNAFLAEDILENKHSMNNKFRSTFWVERKGVIGDILDQAQWFWYVKVKAKTKLISGVCLSSWSIAIIYWQICLFLNSEIAWWNQVLVVDEYFQTQLIVLIPLLYISFCTYYGLFHIQFSGFCCFFKHHNTDAPSLLFGSINFSRVSAPLCYNFLQMLRIQNTSCEKVIGRFDTSVFGNFSSIFFPIVLIAFTMFNFFNVYDMLLEKLNLQKFEFHTKVTQADIDEGKKILYKARVVRERAFLTKRSTDLRNFNGYVKDVGPMFSTVKSNVRYYYEDEESRNILAPPRQPQYSSSSKSNSEQGSTYKSSKPSPSFLKKSYESMEHEI